MKILRNHIIEVAFTKITIEDAPLPWFEILDWMWIQRRDSGPCLHALRYNSFTPKAQAHCHYYRHSPPKPAPIPRLRIWWPSPGLQDGAYLDGNPDASPRLASSQGEELKRLDTSTKSENSRGNFHQTTLSRLGRKFAQALIVSTLEG